MTSKSNKHAEWVRFEITSIISDLNLKIRSSITTLSASILEIKKFNCPNAGVFFSAQILYWSSIEVVCKELQNFPHDGLFDLLCLSFDWFLQASKKSDWFFCFCVDFFQFYVPIQSKVWNSSNAQVMAKHYISFRIIQICLLRWLRMINGVWALYDVKHHL